jgi:hypothetical protein
MTVGANIRSVDHDRQVIHWMPLCPIVIPPGVAQFPFIFNLLLEHLVWHMMVERNPDATRRMVMRPFAPAHGTFDKPLSVHRAYEYSVPGAGQGLHPHRGAPDHTLHGVAPTCPGGGNSLQSKNPGFHEIPHTVTARRIPPSTMQIWDLAILASEVMLFLVLVSAYVFLRLGADLAIWPMAS